MHCISSHLKYSTSKLNDSSQCFSARDMSHYRPSALQISLLVICSQVQPEALPDILDNITHIYNMETRGGQSTYHSRRGNELCTGVHFCMRSIEPVWSNVVLKPRSL